MIGYNGTKQRGLQKAKRILVELLSTLNFEVGGEIAERLYIYLSYW